MARLISHTEPVARKEHDCMAYEFINESCWDEKDFDREEWLAIVEMKVKRGKIHPGEKYLRQFCEMDGDTYTFKANKKMHSICMRYNFYPE